MILTMIMWTAFTWLEFLKAFLLGLLKELRRIVRELWNNLLKIGINFSAIFASLFDFMFALIFIFPDLLEFL